MFTQYSQSNNKPKNQFFMLSNRLNQTGQKPIVQSNPKSLQQLLNTQPEVKIKWGEPVWFLFHTLAHKVKEEEFSNVRIELLNYIVSICQNLPCPTCANHATEYMSKVNFQLIDTREKMKRFLFDFHNKVNKEKLYPLFEFDKLDEKYERANTRNIIYNFFKNYNIKQFNVNMITANMQRELILKKFKVWLNENIVNFNA